MTAPRLLETQCEWTSGELADESIWTEYLDDEERAELDAALRTALAKSDDVLEIGREDFPLPKLSHRLHGIERELIDGAASCGCAASIAAPTPSPRWRCSTGASACTLARRGRRTSTATCSAT
jgi:hypothetical protein